MCTPYKGVPYTIGNIYAVLAGKYDDLQVESAIVKAAKEYIERGEVAELGLQDALTSLEVA
ncbi:hypothetical protein MUK70_11560 [Dyadobacter chenwenxiniae]|nr:hypothetical protein [Dyadobacter chenwenxiniae]UON85616.1 hypothetical protein MUK70_11560 [Dyadobacter chenwenxiniae]